MFKIQNQLTEIYRYDTARGIVCGPLGHEEFLSYLLTEMEGRSPGSEWNYSGTDTRSDRIDNTLSLRPVLYCNSAGTIIDPRTYIEEALSAAERGEIRKFDLRLQEYWHRRQTKRGYQYRKRVREFTQKQNASYRFRYDPVPGISRNAGYSNGTWRSLRYIGVRRAAADPEYGRYIRKQAIPPDPWDAKSQKDYRRCESWKKQKRKKQWVSRAEDLWECHFNN